MSTVGTYYLNSPSLDSATAAYTDSDLKNVAPDGFYSDGVTIREMVGGVFTDIISSCAPCAADCGPTNITYLGTTGYFKASLNTGDTSFDTGAIVIQLDLGTTGHAPLGVYFNYNGTIYNVFSSVYFGLLTSTPGSIVYVGDVADDCGIVGLGLVSLPVYEYNVVTNIFDNTGASQLNQAIGPELALTTGNPGKMVMVIPKTSPTPNLIDFVGVSFCDAIPMDFNLKVNCPTKLASFSSTSVQLNGADTCMATAEQTYYVADVNGTVNASPSGKLGLYDFVYSDFNGQYPLADGFYRSSRVPPTGPPPFGTPQNWFEVQNGIITSFGTCSSVQEWNINFQVENAISGSCATNLTNLNIKISQPPTTYIYLNAPISSSTHIPAGITHVQLRMYWLETYTPCGQVKMVIEKDGVVIAYKILTPTSGIYEYLDVDFNLIADSNIYAYVTLI